MYKFFLLSLLAVAAGQGNSGDLESVINQIFGTPPPATGNTGSGTNPGNVVGGNLGNNNGQISGPSTIVPPGISDVTNDTSCMTENNEVGECVRYYLCNNNTIIEDGVGIIDIRGLDGPCHSYLDSCCLLGNTRPIEDPITPKPVTIPDTNDNKGDDQTPNPQPLRTGCGWRNPEGVGMKTIGDVQGEAKFGEFPWTVAILKIAPVNGNDPDSQKLNVYVGGGSLIHPSVVLTAAHHVDQPGLMRVRAGEWDTQTTKEIYPYQDRDVESKIIHKDFNSGNLFYDIALMFLSKPMELAPNVGLVCLPPPRERVPGGTKCVASGWGKDKFGTQGKYQVILKKVEVPVVDRNTCQNALRSTRLGRFFQLHTSFMCAGSEGKDTCRGDGGSPLVCPIEYEEGRYMQSGIVAWGIECGTGVPGVYVDVSNLRNWIDDKVKGKGFDTRGYTHNI
ncbi:phenoloxidase-activating factor 2-like [Hyposmocoma kahamanoa]|uniref:phenoloxidase-activating factor 2-like n=1 Tax=Hyposmocoma kahamanoa TaxID=1477025 RepID=UPI000E6D835A|nr:phenoloxidase-activating factor 2-like [Hyposmocoma kahamanoa]